MNRSNYQILHAPLIGKARILGKIVLSKSKHVPAEIRHHEYDALRKDVQLLYIYAFRQLKGKDYVKRSLEIIDEIQALNFYIYDLHGWNLVIAKDIDVLCDEIIGQLYAIGNRKS